MKIYNFGNDYALERKLDKKNNVGNKTVEGATVTTQHQEASEVTEKKDKKEVAKDNKKKKS